MSSPNFAPVNESLPRQLCEANRTWVIRFSLLVFKLSVGAPKVGRDIELGCRSFFSLRRRIRHSILDWPASTGHTTSTTTFYTHSNWLCRPRDCLSLMACVTDTRCRAQMDSAAAVSILVKKKGSLVWDGDFGYFSQKCRHGSFAIDMKNSIQWNAFRIMSRNIWSKSFSRYLSLVLPKCYWFFYLEASRCCIHLFLSLSRLFDLLFIF